MEKLMVDLRKNYWIQKYKHKRSSKFVFELIGKIKTCSVDVVTADDNGILLKSTDSYFLQYTKGHIPFTSSSYRTYADGMMWIYKESKLIKSVILTNISLLEAKVENDTAFLKITFDHYYPSIIA
jgi:hypothetical protein